MTHLFGPAMVALFCLSQALRDVYLGYVFQGVSLFAVIVLAFAPSGVVFAAAAWAQERGGDRAPLMGRLAAQWRTVLAMNITTAMAWTSYFFGLAHLEPAVVNTVHSGIGPFTVIAMAAMGMALAGAQKIDRAGAFWQAGVAVSLVGLWWTVLTGRSGMAIDNTASALGALALMIVSGSAITVSHLYARRMHDLGFSAATVTASRYYLIILVAAIALWRRGDFGGVMTMTQGATLAVAAGLLIALPLYLLQIGLARTPQLTAHIIRSLGPVFVFALQPFDARLSWSGATLGFIALYSACAIGANAAQVFRARKAARAASLTPS